jgi:ABC-type Zn2+ transport system substrate-binding protein/surface adhesin
MVSPHSHSHDHDHDHDHGHAHGHSHSPASPHPAQAATWSILRMPVAARLGAAVLVSTGLWAVAWLAMR